MSECGIFFRFTRNSTAILVAFGFVLGLVLSYPPKIQAQSLGEVVITNRYANIRSGLEAFQDSVAIPGNRTFNIEGVFEIIYTVVDNVGISWSDSVTVTVSTP